MVLIGRMLINLQGCLSMLGLSVSKLNDIYNN